MNLLEIIYFCWSLQGGKREGYSVAIYNLSNITIITSLLQSIGILYGEYVAALSFMALKTKRNCNFSARHCIYIPTVQHVIKPLKQKLDTCHSSVITHRYASVTMKIGSWTHYLSPNWEWRRKGCSSVLQPSEERKTAGARGRFSSPLQKIVLLHCMMTSALKNAVCFLSFFFIHQTSKQLLNA